MVSTRLGRITRGRRPALVAVAALAGVSLLAACGSTPPHKAATPPTVATTSSVPAITTPTVILNGKSVTVPTENPGVPITPGVATGQEVVFTDKGFLPAVLYAALKTPVTFTNLSSKTVKINLVGTGYPITSLAPGASFSWTPDDLQFEYMATGGFHGKAEVGAFQS
jgi:hypothetical protein